MRSLFGLFRHLRNMSHSSARGHILARTNYSYEKRQKEIAKKKKKEAKRLRKLEKKKLKTQDVTSEEIINPELQDD